MSMKMTYKGRPFDAGEFRKDIEKDVIQAAVKHLKQQLSLESCPEHQVSPEVLGGELKNDKVKFQIKFCCKEFEEAVSKKF